jgi:aspartyl-tRNA(Asn)/glutamyl-tRNA(Gln) amidotransferase subunit B
MQSYLIRKRYEVCIGLEVHAQVLCLSKLFSRSSTFWNSPPNSLVNVFDAGYPGKTQFVLGSEKATTI